MDALAAAEGEATAGVPDAEGLAAPLREAAGDVVADAVGEGEREGEGVAAGERDDGGEAVAACDCDTAALALALPVGDGDALCVRVAESVRVGVACALLEARVEELGDAVALGV